MSEATPTTVPATPTPGPGGPGGEARAAILDRIRQALQDGPTPDPVERTYRRTSEAAPGDVVEQLVDRLVDYKAGVHREDLSTVADRVADLLGEGARYVVPPGLDPAWLPGDGQGRVRVTEPTTADAGALGVRELDGMDAVVTGSTVSCPRRGPSSSRAAPRRAGAPSPWCRTTTCASSRWTPWWSCSPRRSPGWSRPPRSP